MADYPFDPGEDFVLFDGVEVVTYRSRSAGTDNTFTAVSVRGLVHRPDTVEAELSGEVDVVLHVAADDLGLYAKPRDEVARDDGTTYKVVSAELQSFESRWQIGLVRLRGAVQLITLRDENNNTLTDEAGNKLSGN